MQRYKQVGFHLITVLFNLAITVLLTLGREVFFFFFKMPLR